MTSWRHDVRLQYEENIMADKADKKKKKKNTSLRLDDKTLKELKIRAIQEGLSVQQIIENLIQEYLNKGKKKKWVTS